MDAVFKLLLMLFYMLIIKLKGKLNYFFNFHQTKKKMIKKANKKEIKSLLTSE